MRLSEFGQDNRPHTIDDLLDYLSARWRSGRSTDPFGSLVSLVRTSQGVRVFVHESLVSAAGTTIESLLARLQQADVQVSRECDPYPMNGHCYELLVS